MFSDRSVLECPNKQIPFTMIMKFYLYCINFVFCRMNAILMILISLVNAPSFIDAIADIAPTKKMIINKTQCEAGDVFRMFGYDCSHMELDDVPQNLRRSVQVNYFE